MDMDEFYKFDAAIFEEYIKVGKKADSIATLLKFFVIEKQLQIYDNICK